MKLPSEKAVQDPFFYYYLKIPAIASTDCLPGRKWSGLLDSLKNQIEIGCRSLRKPYTVQSFTSIIGTEYPKSNFSQMPANIPSVNPERTFLEQIFLLHEEFQRPKTKIRVDRLN